MMVGGVWIMNPTFLFGYWALVFFLMMEFQVRCEEEQLESQYGSEYVRYSQKSKRYLPKLYQMANKTSPHILGTASNLLGICLFAITSLHLANKTENSILDELTSLVALLLTISCILSFISIRTNDEEKEYKYEKLADYLFIVSLVGIFGIITFFVLFLWQK